MHVHKSGSSNSITVDVSHRNTTVHYRLGFGHEGCASIKIRKPVIADVDYDAVTDNIMRAGRFKNKDRAELMSKIKEVIPPTIELT